MSEITIDTHLPYWQDYRSLLEALRLEPFPEPDTLNRLLPKGTNTVSGHPVRFVDTGLVAQQAYEQRIWDTGQVGTRANHWHDLFNALVWARWPRSKAAMNAQHQAGMAQSCDGRRGNLRDALTLFDECGMVLLSSRAELLQALAVRDWQAAFVRLGDAWRDAVLASLVGHAMLEKFLNPYKAMTAQALLVLADPGTLAQARHVILRQVDAWLAETMLAGRLLRSPADLSPVPIAGIPGWWQASAQDPGFYADQEVFRPAAAGLQAAPIFPIGNH